MSNAGNESKAARREHAREQARVMREKEQKRARRNKWIVQGSVIVAILAIASLVVAIFVSVNQPAGPGPENMASDGILLEGDGTAITAVRTANVEADAEPAITDPADYPNTVNIAIYVDYQCPFCKQFEETNAEQIEQWVGSGIATLEIHPIAGLDAQSTGNKYSTRAANAAACVANYQPDSYFDVNNAFFADQPEEGANGKTDEELLATMKGAGVDNDDVTKCVTDQTFTDWVKAATDRVQGGTIPNSDQPVFQGTPMVIVNGTYYTGQIDDAEAFSTFVQSIAAQIPTTDDTTDETSSTPTPAPAD